MPEENQLDIFEAIFLYMIEKPSLRWKLKKMIESRDKVDFARLDLELRKMELEILRRNKEV